MRDIGEQPSLLLCNNTGGRVVYRLIAIFGHENLKVGVSRETASSAG